MQAGEVEKDRGAPGELTWIMPAQWKSYQTSQHDQAELWVVRLVEVEHRKPAQIEAACCIGRAVIWFWWNSKRGKLKLLTSSAVKRCMILTKFSR